MPINDQLEVVFVHIPKNGGTTVEYLLGMHGELDTVGILPYRNQVQNEFLFGAGSQEYTASQLIETIGYQKYQNYHSFCISRDPYSRVVSYIAWAKEYRPHATDQPLTVAEFYHELTTMADEYNSHGFDDLYLKPQWHYVCDTNGQLLVDQIFRFEEYDKILAFIADLTGQQPSTNERRMISNHYPVNDYLTPDAITIINRLYERDFALFNYPVRA